jgi:hypothetical protein
MKENFEMKVLLELAIGCCAYLKRYGELNAME